MYSTKQVINVSVDWRLKLKLSLSRTIFATRLTSPRNRHEREPSVAFPILYFICTSYSCTAMQELEKKFSQTGAYKNLKKMLSSKNDQIKDLRQKLGRHEGGLSAGSLGRANMMHGAEEEEEEEEEE